MHVLPISISFSRNIAARRAARPFGGLLLERAGRSARRLARHKGQRASRGAELGRKAERRSGCRVRFPAASAGHAGLAVRHGTPGGGGTLACWLCVAAAAGCSARVQRSGGHGGRVVFGQTPALQCSDTAAPFLDK